jgi:hypothetical protein
LFVVCLLVLLRFNLHTQQTLKAEVQLPEATPPFAEHSASVKQTPIFPSEAGQAVFFDFTTLKTEKENKLYSE